MTGLLTQGATLGDSDLVHRYAPTPSFASYLSQEGISAFSIYQLGNSPRVATAFREAADSARRSHGSYGRCLHLFNAWEYGRMHLYVDRNCLSGFALNGQEVVSVFSHRAKPERQATRTLMALASSLGGVFLNAFDTVLPEIYGRCGYKPVARLAWDDNQAPVHWDYRAMAYFNHGRPDVVFMAYEASVQKVQRVQSYSEGLVVQRQAINLSFAEAV